jgi:predicted RNA-binding Zn-ribbon protein involved in translation (DUF1610 family)
MALIVIKCSRTGRSVSTEMAADQRAWAELPLAWTGEPFCCPQCGEIHLWTKNDARLDAAWRKRANVALVEQ